MTLLEIKQKLRFLETIGFELPNGELVPKHFHVTEVGKINKLFIDCGGTIRNEEVINFQLWDANDYDHRLHPEKLLNIIELSESKLNLNEDLPVEVEYQGDTIGKYNLDFDGQYVPPNSPVLKNKNKITQENLLRKYNIDINNIIIGKRNTRNQTPIY